MKPQFKLRVSSRPIRGNPSTKAEAEVIRKSVSDKNVQLAEAVLGARRIMQGVRQHCELGSFLW